MEEVSLYNQVADSWFSHLILNLLCYGTVFVPGYFLIKYFRDSNYKDRAGTGVISRFIVSCVYGHGYDYLPEDAPVIKLPPPERSAASKAGLLVFCFTGLQVSYLTWGVLQEKIMTKAYESEDGAVGHFKDSQFLVFVNRILAFMLAMTYINVVRQPRHTAPLYKYSFCSFSNIMSSWCQYEALKYVSFPTQVLAKASKIIPTMIMGKIVSARKYEYYEYFTALLISLGMTFFLLGSTEDKHDSSTTTSLSGVIILVGYMTFDAFTSNWQGELFTQHRMSSTQMMAGVNMFSCLLTLASILQQGTFHTSLAFMATYPAFFWDCLILSVCSASGQLFIFYTIATFGPVVFIIIMTIRQGLAILLSCFLYSHPVTAAGFLGISLVFVAIGLKIYCGYRLKQIKETQSQETSSTTASLTEKS